MTIVLPTVNLATGRGEQRFWVVLGCTRCGGITMVEHTTPNLPAEVIQVLPATRTAEQVNHLPQDVDRYYRDAITVLNAGVPDAAAVQLRRTLEAAAKHFDVEPFPLADAVKALMKKGLITKQFGDVIGHVRKIGNIAAHASDEKVSVEEAYQVLRFTTQVLRNLFEVPAELKKLESRAVKTEAT
jgi:hypothetical protein